jgi:Cu-processing system ATP-binding protein
MIRVDNLRKTYGRTQALTGVSLSVAKGEIVALLGPNGAGKSTLLKSVVGLIQPDAGEIRIDGIDMAKDRRSALGRLGFVPQKVCFPPHQRLMEVLRFYAELKGLGEAEAARALHRVGLEPHAHKRVRELSGGMLQRLGLAQSILASPPLLVLDEPTVGLDPHVSCEFRDLLQELNAEGTTIVLTSHLLGEVERLAHRVAILKDGAIAALDTIPSLLAASGLSASLWVKPAEDLRWVQGVLQRIGVPAEQVGTSLRIPAAGDDGLQVLDSLRREGTTIEAFWTTTPTLEEVFRWVVERNRS